MARTSTEENSAPQDEASSSELDVLRRRVAELEANPRYGLVWREIAEAVEQRLRDEVPVLIPETSLNISGALPSDQAHVLIEGDNLHALNVLRATHEGKIDIIYIDPPYNRGKDLIYNDSMVDKADPFRHSKWLSFMAKRLDIAWQLLNNSGFIFISIDDNSHAHLKLLCDKIFGPERFVANFVWVKKRKASNLDRSVRSVTEYILCYAKLARPLIHPDDVVDADKPYPFYNTGNNRKTLKFPSGLVFQTVKNQVFQPQIFKAKKTHVRLIDTVEVKDGISQNEFSLEGEWRYSQQKLDDMIQAGQSVVFKGVDFKPYFINDSTTRYKTMKTLLSGETYGIGTNEDGNQEVAELIGNKAFDYPKQVSLIKNILKAVPFLTGSPVVLDFFAGSGTTLHAVAELNAEDGGTRNCILITNDENDICRKVTVPRVKAVLTGVWADQAQHEALPGSLAFYTTGFLQRSKSGDRMRAELARHTIDLVSVKEAAGGVAMATGEIAVLYGLNKTVAVVPGLEPDHTKLCREAEQRVRSGDRRISYVFTWSDDGVEAEFRALWPGWEVKPLPAEMLSALRKSSPQLRLFASEGL